MKIPVDEQLLQFIVQYLARGIEFGAYQETAGGNKVACRLLEQLKKAIENWVKR